MSDDIFDNLRKNILNIDPKYWVENSLILEGKPFKLSGNGYKPFVDIYRYIGLKAIEPTGKPVIIVSGRQIGKTTLACALSLFFTGSETFGKGDRPPMRIMHLFPQITHAEEYAKSKLNPMIVGSVSCELPQQSKNKKQNVPKSILKNALDDTSDTNDSLRYKRFKGGNILWVDSTGIDADRLRGRTADGAFFDEAQDMRGEAINNTLKILTKSKYGPVTEGIQVFFGTPKRQGSDYHKMWLNSSQQYYYLGCEKCGKYFPLYTPDSDDWEKVWIKEFIVKCSHCEHEQNKTEAQERGKWFSLKGDENAKYVGFHLNQLYNPDVPKEKIIAQKPGNHPLATERSYKNEVLGEFFKGDSSPITEDEIIEKCGEVGLKFRASIMPGEEQIVTLGLDFGERADMEQLADAEKIKIRGQSYSTAVILVAKGAGLLEIAFAAKFKKNDYESKKNFIDQLMRQYSVNLAIGDIGYSNDLSRDLHTIHGDRYLVSRAQGGKTLQKEKFIKEIYPKEIHFDRDFYIGDCFNNFKKGNIKFPIGDYEKIIWLIQHCSSMELKASISRIGEPSVHYVKGTTPNDGFMALINAYIGYKFVLTEGFTNKDPHISTKSISKSVKVPMLLGYCPRF